MDIHIRKSQERIEYIIKDLGLENAKKLSEELGFSRPERIYKILRGTNSISQKLAEIINHKFPQYEIDWLRGGNDEDKDKFIISGNESSIEVERIVDLIFENISKFESNKRFKNYIIGKNKDAIIKYQEDLLRKTKDKIF